jgi:hypothetical protein
MRWAVIGIALAVLLATVSAAAMPPVDVEPWEMAPGTAEIGPGEPDAAADERADCPRYSESEINMIANVVSGEVGGITGTCVLTYADGSQLWADASVLRGIHACVVDNQVKSGMFPDSVSGCVGTYWSTSYTGTGWRDSAQWQSCRAAVVEALGGAVCVPGNVYAATCDPWFASYYPGYYLWARVDWDTGWYSGKFYYYAYGG